MTYKILATVTIPHPGPGRFLPESYQDLIGKCVTGIPGLAPDHDHMCTAVYVEPDGSAATLTITTLAPAHVDLTRHLSAGYGKPIAHVRAFTAEGEQVVEGRYDAPLQPGQYVWINGEPHVVGEISWPCRDPETGGCPNGVSIDWQHATVHPVVTPGPTAAA